MKRFALASSIFLVVNTALMSQTTISLYDKVPNSKPTADLERVVATESGPRVYDVTFPTLTIYKPANAKGPTTAVVICPGGGYVRLTMDHEGVEVAKALNKWGITACVLKYRLPLDSIMLDKAIGPLQDAQRAIQLVRQHAKEWNVDGAKVGILGFSAGGHVASLASTYFDKPVIAMVPGVSLRPDFSILIYPVISFADSIAHRGSRNGLLGKQPSPETIYRYSTDQQVTSTTPPAFLVHASDDKSVVPANSIVYYEALLKHHVAAELHIYQKGGHGFGMVNATTNDAWMDRLQNWMKSNGWLKGRQ